MDTTKYTEEVTPTELRNAYEVAYGEYGANHLIGALFANLPYETIERLYDQAIEKVREDLRVAGQL
jgi:hypothetical protein